MNQDTTITNPLVWRLTLFVTDDSPRSTRARHNLSAALKQAGLEGWPREIDLLKEPGEAIAFGMFATPALLRTDAAGTRAVLYGDFSDEVPLKRFLSDL